MASAAQAQPEEAARVSFTTRTCIARSTFLAGFTYYEIGRYSFQKHHDPAYPVLMTAAFCFAVLAVGLGSFVSFYLERAKTPQQKIDFVDRVNDVFVRGCFRSFLLALLFYILGLGRCGFVYFNTTDMKYFPFTLSLLTVALVIYGIVKIARAQLLLQHNRGVNTRNELLDEDDVVAKALEADPSMKRSGEPMHTFLMRQADTIAGRAVYLTGFCQSGVTRFIDSGDVTGRGYLVCVTLAYMAAVLPAFLLSVISIFINDTQARKQKALAILLKRTAELLFLSYLFAFLALALALTLMGWGCNYSHEAWIPLHAGLAAIAALVSGLVYVWTKNQEIKQSVTADDSTTAAGIVEKAKESVDMILAQINNTGSQATISSGFVFYNVVTFGTDIANNPALLTVSTSLKDAFLEANALTVAAGLVASVFDSILTLFANDLPSMQQRARFLNSTRLMVRVCTFAYVLSLLGFLAGFSLFGLVKFPRRSYVQTWFSVVAGAAILVAAIFTTLWRSRANSRAAASASSSSSSQEPLDEIAEHKLENRPKRMDLMAYRALFFGGFAYFAINFFTAQDRAVSDAYPVFMSATFTLSLTVVLWSALFNINNSLCSGKPAKLIFNSLTRVLYLVSVGVSVTAMLSFVLGFAMIGYIKTIPNYIDYAPVMLIGTVFVGLFLPVVIWIVMRSYSVTKNPHLYVKDDLTFDYKRMMGQIDVTASQASFIAGNVFYEILFSVADAGKFPNYVYFVSATTTFTTGISVIAISTCITFFMARLRSEEQRRRFGRMNKGLKTLLFVLNDICILSWMTSLTVLGKVKYNKEHGHFYYPSLIFGLFGLVLLTLSLLRIKSISNYIVRATPTSVGSAMAALLISPEERGMTDSTIADA